MRLVEQHTIKQSSVYYNELYDLLHKCKNLYNKGLYVVRQHYFQYKNDNTVKYKYLNYYSLERVLKTENDADYRALPTPVAQQVLMMVDRNFKSFFNLFNKKNRGEYSEFVRIPKYLNKDGLFPAVFTTIAFSQKWIKQGIIKLPKQFSFTTRTNKQNIQQLRFVPKNGYIVLEIVYNKKEEINIGKRNNRNFVSIPFNMFISMISYKATLEGVNVKIVEESYTSKCSFLDNERICKHESYKGRRTKRGLFKTSFGKIINADINGAFNIIRKSEKESFDVTMLPEGRGFWWNPVRISV